MTRVLDEAFAGSPEMAAFGLLLVLAGLLALGYVAKSLVLGMARRKRRRPALVAPAARRRPVEPYRPPTFDETAIMRPVRSAPPVSDETTVLYRVLPEYDRDATALMPRIPREQVRR